MIALNQSQLGRFEQLVGTRGSDGACHFVVAAAAAVVVVANFVADCGVSFFYKFNKM